METVGVRYIVADIEAAVAFYTGHLGFATEMNPGGGFALLSRGPLRLYVNEAGAGGAGQAMPDGTLPEPGGWNRIQLQVEGLDALVDRLGQAGVSFRNEITTGRGGRQILVDDPSGNPIELFEPA